MKSIPLFATDILIVIAMLTAQLDAQQTTAQASDNHAPRYRLIDLGTFGGPNSAETVEFPFINNAGMVVGFSDTSIADPNPEGFVFHAFRWNGGPMIDVGSLPGGANSFAIWSNNQGQVVGLSENGVTDPLLGFPEGRATLWKKGGEVVDLGTFGGNEGLAAAINDPGQIVGVAANDIPDPFSIFGWGTQTRAFLWQKGTLSDLGTLGGPDAFAIFVNQGGQVAGVSYTNSEPNPLTGIPTQDPFLWENGRMKDLGTLGGTLGFVSALNNRGEVVGQSNLVDDQTAHPFLWSSGNILDLGTLGGTAGTSTWLNDAGDVVGGAMTTNDEEFHAFFWRKGAIVDLGTIKSDNFSVSHFMNSRGQVVGTSGDCTPDACFEVHGFLWQEGGTIIDLNDFVPSGSDLQVTDGETINDRGEIAGSGMLPNGDFHAIVLVPCADAGKDCLTARENQSASRDANQTTAPGRQRQKLNARETLAVIRARLARRYGAGIRKPH